MWCRQTGTGDDVLLIGGLGDTHELWDSLVERLPEHRATVFDNRGIGRSSRGSAELSIARFAQDALGLMDHLGIDRAHVVGSSMGGTIAQELAVAAPGRVRTLTLAGTWGWPDPYLSATLTYFCRLLRTEQDAARLADAFALWIYSPASFANGTAARLFAESLQPSGPWQSLDAFDEAAAAAIAHDIGARLGGLDMPALVVVGADDRVCRRSSRRCLLPPFPVHRWTLFPAGGTSPTGRRPTPSRTCCWGSGAGRIAEPAAMRWRFAVGRT